ncbi:hypothetical protein TRIATDRAFT_288938 [Trichoderma atroviride IMI 206040]|uniref:Uncharacterized protein n=1 Tax=Hypocrea atroviridis (strain ATCC 20476 / IMI 206040) TaxID=452589 RepID=G9NFJ0_HYPAI|nr:uncharacterized protein TRIATDRAFT_288938 [Trichoderma atroviride IMI 206040]EHK50705.1 hypothetical protein TRIATDRAFT_288938 [Trichoderma atroviride IMI 206040]
MCSHKHSLGLAPIQLGFPGTEPHLAFEAECWDAGCWDNPNANDDALLPLNKKKKKKKRRSYRPRPANKALRNAKKKKKKRKKERKKAACLHWMQ